MSSAGKIVIGTSIGAVAGVVGGIVWATVDNKPKKQNDRIHVDPHGRVDERKLFGSNPLDSTDYAYPKELSLDTSLIEALEVFRTRKGTSRQLFMAVVGSLYSLARTWWKAEMAKGAEGEAFVKEAFYEASRINQNLRGALEKLCNDSRIPCKEIPGYHYVYGPINPQFRRAFSTILTSAANYKHNTKVAVESKKRFFAHNHVSK